MGLNVKLDPDETTTTLVRFIRDTVQSAGAQGVVLGLSGGLDSAVVAALSVRALGADHVHAHALPSEINDAADLADAEAVARHLGIRLTTIPIQPLVNAARETLGGTADERTLANVMARTRMILLYAEAQRRDCLVVGTGNKSELLAGYYTKHGDGGVDLLPIGDLYKTQVRELANHLGIPANIIARAPSAGLWKGQTDEAELGLHYETLDTILLGLEIDLPPERIAAEAGVPVDEVARIETLRRRTQHKRTGPLVCKLGIRSTGSDWRDPETGTGTAG